jgi:hypothetical protein
VAVLQADTAAAPHAGADPAVPGVEEHRQLRFREHLIQGIRDAIVREELHDGRVQFQPSDLPGRYETARLGDSLLAALRVDAGKRNRDVGVLLRVGDDLVVGEPFHAAQRFVHRKDDERHVAGPVVVGHGIAVARSRRP